MYMIRGFDRSGLTPVSVTAGTADIALTRTGAHTATFTQPAAGLLEDITTLTSYYGGGTNDPYVADLVNHVEVGDGELVFGGSRGLKATNYEETFNTVDYAAITDTLQFDSQAQMNEFASLVTNGRITEFPDGANVADRDLRPTLANNADDTVHVQIGANEWVVGPPLSSGDVRVITPNARLFVRTNQGGLDVAVRQTAGGASQTPSGDVDVTAGDLVVTDGDALVITAYDRYSVSAVNDATRLYPADRCVFNTSYVNDFGYHVTSATFYDGVSANPLELSEPVLGYIGKSGRFVPIAD